MLYKFDILFTKELANGGLKTLSYSQLLDNPRAFGENETLEGAIGSLSLVKEGAEKGFSLNSLLRRYNSLLIGRPLASIFSENFTLEFTFADGNDVTSIQAQLANEEGYNFCSEAVVREINGEDVLNLTDLDSPVMIISEDGDVELNDEIGSGVIHKRGEVGFVMVSTNQVVIKAEKAKAIQLTLDNY